MCTCCAWFYNSIHKGDILIIFVYSYANFQVVIFVKSVQRCMALANLLTDQNFPAIAIHRGMTQEDRLARYQQFKDFQKRILVATNLFGRGMDIERVNIVFNYDMPEDTDTYLHRVARAGRFGTKVRQGLTFKV